MGAMATTDAAARLTIDLAAIVANWRELCARHGGEVAAVLKADGYGLGAAPIGRALMAAGCRSFFVAQLAEGMALREALGDAPRIAVLNGFAPGADAQAGLTPVLNSLGDIAAWRGEPRAAFVHLDTGMARLGLDSREAERLVQDPTRLGGLRVAGWMSHLACADAPQHPLNARQAARFAALCERLPAAPRSLANSSGIFLGGAFRSDLARPGAALHGINPQPGAPNPLRQAVRLDAPVLQIREIATGESVGYGASWTAARPSRIATVAAGYADGYLRSLSGRGEGFVGDAPIPLVGRVSMDLLTFDATDQPRLRPGDAITLIGPRNTPDDVAARAGTIAYEVLTSLGTRYARRYAGA
jgi:alanine racemase